MPIVVFTLVPLLVAFAVLAVYDIVDFELIDLGSILLFVLVFIAIFLFRINFSLSQYAAATPGWEIAAVLASMAAVVVFPRLGMGDKLFLVATFLVYPFWLMWIVIVLAQLLVSMVFRLVFHFRKNKDGSLALPFYPFLFIAALLVYFITVHYGLIAYYAPSLPHI